MRELKFRAWDANTFQNGGSMHYGGFSIHATGKVEYLTYFVHEGSPVMQYTGLKDREGKDIYEGDILEFRANYTAIERCGWQIGEIRWGGSDPKFCIFVKGFDEPFDIINETDEFNHKAKVIGNIYQNPELIK